MSAKSKTKKGKDGARDTSPEPTPCTSHKSKRRRLSTDDEDDSGSPKRPSAPHPTSKLGHNGLRSPSFTPHNKPAELFRKDLISAMKLADSEPLQQDYIFIADPWRQDWEKGVQVPVNPGEIPKIEVKQLYEKPSTGDFKIPRKYLHATQDETFRQGIHELTGMQQLSEQVVRYDLDDLDVTWLEMANEEREELGLLPIHEWTMERVIEALETHCHEKIGDIMKTEEGLGIEYDEDIVCEVCRSPDSEETNEMVFCDGCDICVHQACYGIQNIPEGRWLCRTCSLGIKPTCILCPRTGGAMKSTKSGTKWAHVSCALWIPEVSIGCVEKMEPITKISNIPASRWALVCCVCKDRVGACIQCSVKTCKTAFHVTCAIFNGLEMKTILDDSDDGDGVKLKAFCPRHSKKRERSHSDSEADSPRKEAPSTPRKDLSKEEVANLRAKKLAELQNHFYQVVDSHAVAEQLAVEEEVVELILVFWKLKRKTNFDKSMLMPKTEEADMLEKQQEDSLVARMKMFVHLRQDLERVRNLCYMISRREKTKRQYYKARENTFMAAVHALTDERLKLSAREAEKIAKIYRDKCLYEGYDSQEKPKVVSRLSFTSESMLASPHTGDDTESMDSDSRDVALPFRGRSSSRGSNYGKSHKGRESPFLIETEKLIKPFEDFDKTETESESVSVSGECESLHGPSRVDRTQTFGQSEPQEDRTDGSGADKPPQVSRKDHTESAETELEEKVVIKLPKEKSHNHKRKRESLHGKEKIRKKVGRPPKIAKGFFVKNANQPKIEGHRLDLIDKPVREQQEQHVEKTDGQMKVDKNVSEESEEIAKVTDERNFEKVVKEIKEDRNVEKVKEIKEDKSEKVVKHMKEDRSVEKVVKHMKEDRSFEKVVKHVKEDRSVEKVLKHMKEDRSVEKAVKHVKEDRGVEKVVKHIKEDRSVEKQIQKMKEKSEKVSGRSSSERTFGKEKHDRHLGKESPGGKGDNRKHAAENIQVEKVDVSDCGSGDADMSAHAVREKVRGKGKDKIKMERGCESEYVDVMEVDPPGVSASFHPNIDPRLDLTMPELEKVKIEEPLVFEVERSRRSLRENRPQIEMPKVDVSPTRHSSPDLLVEEVVEVIQPVRESKKPKHRRHGHRRHRRGEHHRSSEKRRERSSSHSKDRKMSDYVKPEVNGVIRKSSKYVVENSVKERVQNKLLKSRRLRYINGVQDKSQQKIDSFFQAKSPDTGLNNVSTSSLSLRTSSRILNEISPDKGKVQFENNLFGAHYTPKGSLSGYKIPKKGDSAERTPLKSQTSCEKVDEKSSDFRSTRRKVDIGAKRDIFAETGFDVLSTDSDFGKDVELVTDSRGYRSHSPLSSVGTDVSDVRHSPSREGTPRRVTRSQHLDVDENSVDSVHSTRSNMKLRLGEGWLRPSKFSS